MRKIKHKFDDFFDIDSNSIADQLFFYGFIAIAGMSLTIVAAANIFSV